MNIESMHSEEDIIFLIGGTGGTSGFPTFPSKFLGVGQSLGSCGFSETPTPGIRKCSCGTTAMGAADRTSWAPLWGGRLLTAAGCPLAPPPPSAAACQGSLDGRKGSHGLSTEHLHALLGLWSLKLRCLVTGAEYYRGTLPPIPFPGGQIQRLFLTTLTPPFFILGGALQSTSKRRFRSLKR